MPYYDFICDDCDEEFEEYCSIDEDQLNVCCPSCGSRNVSKDYSSICFGGGKSGRKSKKDKDSGCGFSFG